MNIRPYKAILPTLATTTYIDPAAHVIGDVRIGDNASLWPLVVARGDVNYISIGRSTNVQDGSILHVTRKSNAAPSGYPLIIGDNVTVGHQCMLHGCRVGNNVLIGMGSTVMDNAIVEDNVFIGAGSLVPPNKVLVSGYLYLGNPVKQIRRLREDELAFLPRSADNYVLLKDEYLEMSE